MRLCYNIVRQYDSYAEVFASFSHSWTENSNPGWYTCKEMIDDMQSRGITVPDASGSTGTQAGGTPDGSAADNTTADNSDNNTDNE